MRFIGAEELRQAAELTHLIDALEAGHAKRKSEMVDTLIGGFSADTREADDDVLIRGRLSVNCRETALLERIEAQGT